MKSVMDTAGLVLITGKETFHRKPIKVLTYSTIFTTETEACLYVQKVYFKKIMCGGPLLRKHFLMSKQYWVSHIASFF